MVARPHAPSGKRRWLVLASVIIASTGLTVFAGYYASRTARLQAEEEFRGAVMEAQAAVQTRMEAYLALLRGGVGLMAAEPEVTRAQFQLFVDRLRVPEHYPGIQGIGFTLRVPQGTEQEVIASAHRDGITGFKMWPETTGEDPHTILYLEPQDRRNQAALGFNMFSHPVRREAMQRACDTGRAVASGGVELVQEIEGPKQVGFLIYLPVYEGGDVPPTVEAKRAALRGFIYSPFRADDLFEHVFSQRVARMLDIEIYDGEEVNPDYLLHRSVAPDLSDNPASAMETIVRMEMATRPWTLRFSRDEQPSGRRLLAPTIIAVGSFLTLLIALFMISEASARRRAEDANEQLKRSEQSLRDARKRLEQHAQELERRVAERTALLQQSLKDLEAVLYHVAHDLRAPVRAMGSFASILHEEYKDQLDSRANEYLVRISSGASRMDRLVSDLLSFGRLAQVSLPAHPVPLEIPIDEILKHRRSEIASKGASVEVRRPLPFVQANQGALSEVLQQLIDNSLKFCSPDRPPQVRIWATNRGNVRLHIRDNGIGVKPEYHERIFRVFEKLHSHGTYPGTGIGLAIVRKAIERMGGSTGVESTPGEGSTFWIELPPAAEAMEGVKHQ
jgi:signal transduction histidine kinase